MLALSLILIGVLLRFMPHAPNFTPVAAIALFSGTYLNKKYALLIPLVLMIVSDIFIGLHDVVIFTWGSFVLITLLGFWIKRHKNMFRIISASLFSSFLFYVVSNFGVWLAGWYPHNLRGLIDCYIMALPFLRNFTSATIFYVAVFFGIYELTAYTIKDTKLSRVLLNN